jgi:hypothetical protein
MIMDYSYALSKDQYNNLLPVMRGNLLERDGRHFFIGTLGQFNDAMRRCAYLD